MKSPNTYNNLKINKKRLTFINIIAEICNELNIKYQILSEGWIIKLQHNSEIKYIYLYSFGLNEDSSAKICTDKYATYTILKNANIPVVEHKLIYTQIYYYKKDTSGNWKKIQDFFYKHNKKIVIKPNKGSSGKNIFFVENETQLEKAINSLLSDNTQIVLSPYYDIKYEYRAVVLNNNVELIFRKEIPKLTGDGKKTILQLLQQMNINNPKIYLTLIEQNYELDTILPQGKKIPLLKQHNLTGGAYATTIPENKTIEKLALKTANELNMKFLSVDIIETTNENFLVIEVNSGITLVNFALQGNYQTVKKIYKKAIKLWFNL